MEYVNAADYMQVWSLKGNSHKGINHNVDPFRAACCNCALSLEPSVFNQVGFEGMYGKNVQGNDEKMGLMQFMSF